MRRTRDEAALVATLFAITALVLYLDRNSSLAQQRLLGAAVWLLLLAMLRRESALVRTQVGVVVVFATAVEYTFAGVLEVYTYRLDNVPVYVPPGHGLVYLGALMIGRLAWVHGHRRGLRAAVVLVGGAYAAWGLTVSDRVDLLGAIWFACLVGFLFLGSSQGLYIGAFVVVTFLELLGTHWQIWTWAAEDPLLGVSMGNPPSGAAGGYGWFDLAALILAPRILARVQGRGRARAPVHGAPQVRR
ncbi:MAG: hypothetical protein ACT4PP_01290 [Sporichthyaceae bacterium]